MTVIEIQVAQEVQKVLYLKVPVDQVDQADQEVLLYLGV